MAINNVNGPTGSDRPARNARDTSILNSGRTRKTAGSEKTSETQAAQNVSTTEQASSDTVQISRQTRQVEQLTSMVENMEDTPREEAVSRAEKRVRSGYYSTPEFMEQLALKITAGS